MAQLVMKRPAGAAEPEVAAVTIREATAADAAALAALLGAAFPEIEWDEARARRDLLDAADVPVTYVIEGADGGLKATASVRYTDRFPGCGYVHWVGVAPEERGKRLGTAVMTRVLSRFAEDGMTTSILETDDVRLPAIASYLGQGFIPHYTDADHEDRWSRVFETLAASRRSTRGN